MQGGNLHPHPRDLFNPPRRHRAPLTRCHLVTTKLAGGLDSTLLPSRILGRTGDRVSSDLTLPLSGLDVGRSCRGLILAKINAWALSSTGLTLVSR